MSTNSAEGSPLITFNGSHPPLASPEIDDLGDEPPKVANSDAPNSNVDNVDDDQPPVVDDLNKNNEDEYNDNNDDEDNLGVLDEDDFHRFSPEGENDEVDGVKIGLRSGFPYAPDFGPGLATSGLADFDTRTLPDLNEYQQKKTLAKGMMDLALFSANANQLRYVLESSSRHPYYYPSIVFISFSLVMQVAVGVGLVWNALYNVKKDDEIHTANTINNFTTIGIFLVTVVNVFICSFGVVNGTALSPLVNATTST